MVNHQTHITLYMLTSTSIFFNVKETNEEVASQSGGETNEGKSDNDSDSSDLEEEMPDDSDDDGYNGYGGYTVMNTVNVIEVIIIVTEDTKEKPPQ
jgi:hypothetical protein